MGGSGEEEEPWRQQLRNDDNGTPRRLESVRSSTEYCLHRRNAGVFLPEPFPDPLLIRRAPLCVPRWREACLSLADSANGHQIANTANISHPSWPLTA